MLISKAYKLALEYAMDHASKNAKCAHFGCAAIIDDKISFIVCNDPNYHAEINTLLELENQWRLKWIPQ